jgi:anthranilate/para-aminobenzoate synthase component I
VRIRVDDARPSEVDVLVTIHPVAGTHPDGRTAEALARHAAAILADRPDIHALVPGGVGVAV